MLGVSCSPLLFGAPWRFAFLLFSTTRYEGPPLGSTRTAQHYVLLIMCALIWHPRTCPLYETVKKKVENMEHVNLLHPCMCHAPVPLLSPCSMSHISLSMSLNLELLKQKDTLLIHPAHTARHLQFFPPPSSFPVFRL